MVTLLLNTKFFLVEVKSPPVVSLLLLLMKCDNTSNNTSRLEVMLLVYT